MATECTLVVGDERNIVDLAQMYLEQASYSVESARAGEEALTRARHTRPALVVLDLVLPGLDGWRSAGVFGPRAMYPSSCLQLEATMLIAL